MPSHPVLQIEYPPWVDDVVDWNRRFASDTEKMRLAIAIARENVRRDSGGPFGAAVLERDTGRVVAVGMNRVIPLNNCVLHGETVAVMMAQRRVGSYTLKQPAGPAHELVTSCEPCAMCLGATLWSGVVRLVCGAGREDATRLGFEEGPVFAESYRYLEQHGIEVIRNVMREEASTVLEAYRAAGGKVYNG